MVILNKITFLERIVDTSTVKCSKNIRKIYLNDHLWRSNSGVGKPRPGGHMRPVKLLNLARQNGINYDDNAYYCLFSGVSPQMVNNKYIYLYLNPENYFTFVRLWEICWFLTCFFRVQQSFFWAQSFNNFPWYQPNVIIGNKMRRKVTFLK